MVWSCKGAGTDQTESVSLSRAADEPPAPPKPKAFRADMVEKILAVRDNPEGNGKQLYIKIRGAPGFMLHHQAAWAT